MKKLNNRQAILLAVSLMIIIKVATAQTNTPSTTTKVTATSTTVYTPSAYTAGTPVNYIRTWQPQRPYTLETDVTSSSRAVTEVNKATQYFDGLGRPLQTVGWQASPGKQDLIAPIVYDEYGREAYQFLPYAGGSDGGFKMINPFNEQKTFYSSTYTSQQPSLSGEQVYYGKTDFEASPLNRPLKTMAPGNSWAGSNKGVSIQYLINNASDQVHIWNTGFDATVADNTNIPTGTTVYDAGQLYKTVTIDEQGNATVEYKDKEGQVVLKKVQNGTVPADYSGHNNFLCTYYVYDDLSQLRFVIPPKAVAGMNTSGSWVPGSTVISELCFRYEYDSRRRMIAKKVPGAGWVYMVYDVRDRLVFMQDANLRAKAQWMTTLYDEINRPIQTALLTGYGGTREQLQAYVNGLNAYVVQDLPATGEMAGSIPADLTASQWQPGINYQATNSITLLDGFQSTDGATYTVEIIPGTTTTFSGSQATNSNPTPPGGTLIALTYTYYDDYSWTSKRYNSAYNSKLGIGNNGYGDDLPTATNIQIRGLVTGTRVRVLEDVNNPNTGKWLETATFYDDKGRATQVQSDNYKGGKDVLTSRYDFTGKVISSYQVHNYPAAGATNQSILTEIDYDHAGRILTIRKKINEDNNTLRTIARNSYDALGKLKTKQVGQQKDAGGTPTAAALETQDYGYNIRGWLKGINWEGYGSTATRATANRWFAMDLSYDWGYQTNQYNGNIAGMRWQSNSDKAERSYGFGYDNVNRLLFADFKQNTSGWNNSAGFDFTVKMGTNGTANGTAYDENGNIRQMQQWGMKGTASTQIDNLAYTYNDNSNKLKNVVDNNNDPQTVLGDFRTSANHPDKNNTTITRVDYTYDANGNLLKDLNKDIGTANTNGIIYNHLNLPWQITMQNKGTIIYIYDAAGNKLEKRVAETGKPVKTTSYLGSYVYEDNALQYIGNEEGRMRKSTTSAGGYAYDYFLKDHLGNVRMVLTDEQQQDVYPAATLEGNIAATGSPNAINKEKDYYNINTSFVVDKSLATGITDYYNHNGNPPPNNNPSSSINSLSQKVYKLTGSNGTATGLGITLKVMAGDNINIFGKSYYFQNSASKSFNIPALEIFTGLFASPTGAIAGKGLTAAALNANSSIASAVSGYLNNTDRSLNGNVPLAFINWMFFDENCKFVSGRWDQAGSANAVKNHALTNIAVPQNGYVYVYVSNESPTNVFFDNLQVIHNRGPLVEETHYASFGLQMAGISSKAAGKTENKLHYNGKEDQRKEFADGSGLEWIDYGARMYDAQIGRWHALDPLSEDIYSMTPFAYCANNPIKYLDPDGRWFTLYYYEQNEDGSYKNIDKKGNPVASTITLKTMDDLKTAGEKSDNNSYVIAFVDAVNYIMQEGADKGITKQLLENEEAINVYNPYGGKTQYGPNGNMLPWDPEVGLTFQSGKDAKVSSPAISLLHELGHAYGDVIEKIYPESFSDPDFKKKGLKAMGEDNRIVQEWEKNAGKVLGVSVRDKYENGAAINIQGGVTSTTPAAGQSPMKILKDARKWKENTSPNQKVNKK